MDLISRNRVLPILAAGLLCCLTASPALAQNLVYTVHGQFVSMDSSDSAGLDGARFRLTVSIDSAALPASTEQSTWHESATFQTPISVLELFDSPGVSSDGVFSAIFEEMSVIDRFSGDYCVKFGAEFNTPSGTVSIPELCFGDRGGPGALLSIDGIGTENLIAFSNAVFGAGSYSVIDGAIDVLEAAH